MKRIIVGILVLALAILSLGGCTSTPVPTSTPEKPALTTAEQAYATTVADQTVTVGGTLAELGELFRNPQIGNDQWTLQVSVQLVTIRMAYDEAMELDPPSSMAEIHLKYTQAMSHLNDATYLITRGVDELDPSLIDEASQKIHTGGQLIEETTRLVVEFGEAHK